MVDERNKTECGTIGIMIVDDHPIVREGIHALLSREPDFHICGAVGTIAEALQVARSTSPQVAIIDLMLEEEHGFDLIRHIKAINPRIRILACSMYDDRIYAERAIESGSQGYVNKRESIHCIIDAIRAVMAGTVYVNDHIKQQIIQRSLATEATRPKSPHESLSNRELEVFRLIGKGMTTTEIGQALHLSSKTVDTHRQNIRRHLQLDNTHKLAREAVQWVLENG